MTLLDDRQTVSQDDQSLVSITDVAFGYGDGPDVIEHLDLTIRRGEKMAIIGPSGCGKSSLLSLIAGLTQPRRGAISVAAGAGPSELGVAMMFQKETLLPWLSVRDNVALASRFRSGRRRQNAGDVGALLEMVGLSGSADQYPYQLSGGMRRRAQLLAAVYSRPRVLLLDEPFSALDEPTRVGVHADVLRIVEEFDIALVLVTHDVAEAITLADRVVVLSTGPAHVASIYETDLGEHRDVTRTRELKQYQDLYAQIWHELSEQSLRAAKPREVST